MWSLPDTIYIFFIVIEEIEKPKNRKKHYSWCSAISSSYNLHARYFIAEIENPKNRKTLLINYYSWCSVISSFYNLHARYIYMYMCNFPRHCRLFSLLRFAWGSCELASLKSCLRDYCCRFFVDKEERKNAGAEFD